MSRFGRKKPPRGYDVIEPVMVALDDELREGELLGVTLPFAGDAAL